MRQFRTPIRQRSTLIFKRRWVGFTLYKSINKPTQ